MSDPDLFSSDPLRRHAAQIREDSRKARAPQPVPSKPSGNRYAGTAILIFLVLFFVDQCSIEKSGDPVKDEITQIKRKDLNPTVEMRQIIDARNRNRVYGEVKNIRAISPSANPNPAIALVYSQIRGGTHIGVAKNQTLAKEDALKGCTIDNEISHYHGRTLDDAKCKIVTSIPPHKNGCITYSAVKGSKSTIMKNGQKYTAFPVYEPFFFSSEDIPSPSNNIVKKACSIGSKDYPPWFLEKMIGICAERVRTVCNYDYRLKNQQDKGGG